jgi:hypothetical protein
MAHRQGIRGNVDLLLNLLSFPSLKCSKASYRYAYRNCEAKQSKSWAREVPEHIVMSNKPTMHRLVTPRYSGQYYM